MEVKIQPLHTTVQVLTWLCLLPPEKTINKWTKFGYHFTTFTVVTISLATLPTSVAYFLKFLYIDLEKTFYAIFQIIGIGLLDITILISYCLRHKITLIFDKLNGIYAESKRIFLKLIYTFAQHSCALKHFFLVKKFF